MPNRSLRMPRRRLLASAGALGAAFALRAAPRSRAQPESVQQVLSNGLTVVVQERPSADVVALQHTALAGFRDDDHPGITVMTSRMLLAGTPTRPSDIAMRTAATLVGGTISRGTTAETSSISIEMPGDSAELAFDLASDAVINPLFAPEGLLSQRELALQGLSQRRSSPGLLLDDLFQASLFAGQPLGFPPLGTGESLRQLTAGDLIANWQRLWGGSNSVVTVAGRIHPQNAFDLAAHYFGALFAGSPNVRQPSESQAPVEAKTIHGNAGQQQQFRLGFTAPSLSDSDRYPMAILTGIMSGFSGRLLRELRTQRGIAYTPSAAFLAFSDAGEWYATASVDPDKLDEALAVTRGEIQRLLDERASDSEVSDAIEAIAGSEVLATETDSAVARRMAAEQILGEVTAEEFVRRVRTVTPDDAMRVARQYLDLDHSLTVLVGPPASS
jgi:zinc protease